jgi:hypothetical protein
MYETNFYFQFMKSDKKLSAKFNLDRRLVTFVKSPSGV